MSGLIAFLLIIYSVIFYLIAVLAQKRFDAYSMRDYSVSKLGIRSSPMHGIFNTATFGYGILLAMFGLLSGGEFLDSMMIVVVGVCTLLLAIIPYDRRSSLHNAIAVISSVAINIYCIKLVMYIDGTTVLDLVIQVLAWGIVLTTMVFVVMWIGSRSRIKNKNVWVWQWLLFSLEVLLVFALSLGAFVSSAGVS